MQETESRAIVYFLTGEEPRKFANLREAIAFLSAYCPAEAVDTAWVEIDGERVEAAMVRSLEKD